MSKLSSLMKNIVIIILVSGAVHAAEKIAILDFKSLMAPEELGIAVAEILRTELGELGEYTIIERGMLKQILDEQTLQLSGTVDSETAVKIGKLIGANIVVTGYFNNNVIFTSPLNTDPVTQLSFTLNNNGTKDATSVIFDNFYLSCDQMIQVEK